MNRNNDRILSDKFNKMIQDTWCEFTDQEIESIQGEVDRLALALQNKYSTSPEEARRQAELFKSRFLTWNRQP